MKKTTWEQTRGVVYFVQVAPAGPIKIGFTSGLVHNRVRSLQQTSPHELKWIGFFAGTPEDERAAHKHLTASRCRGEWFHPTLEVLSFVTEKCAASNEQDYFRDVMSRDCLERISAAWKPYSRNYKVLDEIMGSCGLSRLNFFVWRDGRHPPPRAIAEKLAAAADQILLSRRQAQASEDMKGAA